ncbi:CST complex subunit TEN1 isoform X1 [Sardina pilchardus]|uniref:CST complex subunit TEN1 isoform X1 n=1 Tax=Sardina pilchardus TaxID=27697 RepID=UPI002E103E08
MKCFLLLRFIIFLGKFNLVSLQKEHLYELLEGLCCIIRLTCYQPEESKAILSSHHSSMKYQVSVRTSYVEPFNPICGALYIVLGEIENTEEGSGVMLQARVMNCVDGVDLALLQKAINEQRSFLQEREDDKGSTSG